MSASPFLHLSPIQPPPGAPFARRRAYPFAPQKMWSIDVLVIEDDEADRTLIADVLKRHPNVRTVRVSDAAHPTLFELASGDLRPNLILLDIHMPRLNGFQFLKALRCIPAMIETPVVFLTTSHLARDVEEARASTASHYVVKPDSYDELQSRLGRVIQQTTTGAWSV